MGTNTRVAAAAFVGTLFLGVMQAKGAAPVYNAPAETATLPPGPNAKVAEQNCGVCHSYEYILTQPRGSGRDFWQASVTKMIKVFGAPIQEADANAIVDYLAGTFK